MLTASKVVAFAATASRPTRLQATKSPPFLQLRPQIVCWALRPELGDVGQTGRGPTRGGNSTQSTERRWDPGAEDPRIDRWQDQERQCR